MPMISSAALVSCFLAMALGDPLDILTNGDFEDMRFSLSASQPSLEILSGSPASIGGVPGWRVDSGGVQVLSNLVFYSPDSGSSYCIHLNSQAGGPGTLRSVPLLVSPRAGATYNVSWTVAPHPDGGPPSRTMKVSLLFNGNARINFTSPTVLTNVAFSRSFVNWTGQQFSFVGTGQPAFLEFTSCTAGKYGLLIDDVQVSLRSLIENGDFESGNFNLSAMPSDGFLVLESPSDALSNWFVSSGSIKYAPSRYKSSVESSPSVVDLNGNSAGAMTTSIFTHEGRQYSLMFDFAPNPEASPPLSGTFYVTVISNDDGTVTVNHAVIVSSALENQSLSSIDWETGSFIFVASGSSTNLTFISQITGSLGPLLDNVEIYEINENYTTVVSFQSAAQCHRSRTYCTGFWLAVCVGLLATVSVPWQYCC